MRPVPVLLGGGAAGLVLNAGGIVLAHSVLGAAYMEAFLAHLAAPPGGGMALRHVAIRFGLGFLCVLLQAALRPALGRAAPAATAGALFLSGYVPLSLMLFDLGILRGGQLAVSLAWGAAEILLATLLGALVFRKTSRGN